MSSVPCRTALRCFDSFGMEETLPSITPMVVIRLSNRQDVARNDEIRAMHSLKTSLTISPVKRACIDSMEANSWVVCYPEATTYLLE